MQNIDSNLVYVVSLGSKKLKNWEIGWQDIVNKKHNIFENKTEVPLKNKFCINAYLVG